jgi:superfamily I DNA/RNA helicase
MQKEGQEAPDMKTVTPKKSHPSIATTTKGWAHSGPAPGLNLASKAAPPAPPAKSVERKWSVQQLAIFDEVENGTGNLVVIARAGCGKTTTAIEAVNHVPTNESCVYFAFSKDIANELKTRTSREVATFHSYGYRGVRKMFPAVVLDQDKLRRIARDGMRSALCRSGFSDEKLCMMADDATRETRAALCDAVSKAKATLAGSEAAIDALLDAYGIDTGPVYLPNLDPDGDGKPVEVTRAKFCAWAHALMLDSREETATIDFDDMVWFPIVYDMRLFQYDRVFIDETQDLNACQIELALKSVNKTGRICAIGDDRQAIYAFRGADSKAMSNVIKRLKAKTLPLSVTYRCAKSIVKVANEIVPDLTAAPGAPEGVVERIANDEGKVVLKRAEAGDFVLSRSNAPLVGLCLKLLAADRPATIQGRDIGGGLVKLLQKSKCATVDNFTVWIEEYKIREIRRLEKAERSVDDVVDRVECLHTLCEGEKTIQSVIDRIYRLFDDPKNGGAMSRIVLSTTHRAKGLERPRVFVLAETYWKGRGVEEDNLWYVATTRAKTNLVLIGERSVPKPRYGGES